MKGYGLQLNHIVIMAGTTEGGYNADLTIRTASGAAWKRMQFMDKDLTKLASQVKRAITKIESEFKP